jgi:RNA-binding protein 26
MHNATAAVEGEQSTEDLKVRLEKLKAEVRKPRISHIFYLTFLQAASLGITETTDPYYGGTYRPYRGRGRGGRGIYRGSMRGGPPRGSMKLDNRPKQLLVKGAREGNLQALRDWFEACIL